MKNLERPELGLRLKSKKNLEVVYMKYVVVDVETAGLDAKLDRLVPIWCVGFAWRKEDGGIKKYSLTWSEGVTELNTLLEDKETVLVFHNAAYDVQVLRARGVDIPSGRYVCSALASYMLEPGSDVSLSHLAEKYGSFKADVKTALENLGRTFRNYEELFRYDYGNDQAALEVLLDYCAQDCAATLVVWEKAYAELSADPKVLGAYFSVELPYVEVVMEMEKTGLYVDKGKLSVLRANLEKRVRCLFALFKKLPLLPEKMSWVVDKKKYEVTPTIYEKKGFYKSVRNIAQYYTFDGKVCSSNPTVVYDHCKLSEFNPNSSAHLAFVLMKQGWKPEKFTESGKPATDDEVISKLKFPLARIFSAYAEYNKLINTFVLGIEEGMDSKGFCHGSFNQMTTKTTRMSSSSPNLQNLPARTALGAKIRECVVAPPGYSLVVGDLDQIELRVLAYYLEKVMGDSAMAKAARQGIDAHTANAKLWGVSRKQAKGGIFAVNYGASAKRLAITLKTSEQDAKALIENINTGSPSIAALKQLVWKACKKRGGYIYLLFGHRVFYPDITSYDGCLRSAAERQTFNCLIQGSAGAIHKELMLRGMPYLRSLGGMYACTVHDEVLLYVPTENCEKLVKFFNEVYHNKDILCHDKGYVPVTAEFKEGSNWVVAKG